MEIGKGSSKGLYCINFYSIPQTLSEVKEETFFFNQRKVYEQDKVQLTFEQHRFEPFGFTYMHILKNKHIGIFFGDL